MTTVKYFSFLQYKVPFEQLGTRAIWLTVWNVSKFGHRLFLGEVCIPLTSLNLKQPTEKWYKLNDVTETEIPGLVAPTAPVHIEEDLLARAPLPYRSRTTAVTMGSIRSKSGSPSHVPLGVSLDHNSPVHIKKDDFRSKSASPPDVTKRGSSVSLDLNHSVGAGSDEDLFPALVGSKTTTTTTATATTSDAAAESIEDFRSKSATPPDVSVSPPSPTSLSHSEDDLFPVELPPRRRTTAITTRAIKKEFRSKSASPPVVSVSPAASSFLHDSEEDLFSAGPHRSRTTATITGSIKSFRSKSASPPDLIVSPPKIVVEDSEASKPEYDADLFSGFTSYKKP